MVAVLTKKELYVNKLKVIKINYIADKDRWAFFAFKSDFYRFYPLFTDS